MTDMMRLSAGLALLGGLVACDSVTDPTANDEAASAALRSTGALRYQVFALPGLGGADSAGNGITDLGTITGYSDLSGAPVVRHATLWQYGVARDLGTLGGPNSSSVWPAKNLRGVVAGIAETAEVDPNNEAWSCQNFFPSLPPGAPRRACRGFVWERGEMRALPTLGGTHGFATGTDNRGRVVGWAENTVRDATCRPPQVLQFRATIWGPGKDQIRELPPLSGDTTSAATAINDRGQVVGISGICDNAVGRFSAAHAVLWQGDTVTDLGNLGGSAWNTPMAISQRGDVAGFANVPTDPPSAPGRFAAHGFLWTQRDGIEELEPIGDDIYSQALGLNERRQAVGQSCSAGFATCRAVLWQNGEAIDLNTRIAGSQVGPLVFAGDINNWGWITGQATSATGELVAYVAIPHLGFGADGEAEAVPAAAPLAEHMRAAIFQRLGLPRQPELVK